MIQYALTVANDHPYRSPDGSNHAMSATISHTPSLMPGHPLLETYLESYFLTIQSALPFLEEEGIRQAFFNIRQGTEAQQHSPTLLLVLALGAALSREQGPSSSFHSMQLFLLATQNLHQVTRETNCETLQLLLLCTLFSMFNPCGGSTWHLLGLASQTCLTLGLHHLEPGPDLDMQNGGSLEMSAFWSTYILDRCVCLFPFLP